jgi:hypothetical protein
MLVVILDMLVIFATVAIDKIVMKRNCPIEMARRLDIFRCRRFDQNLHLNMSERSEFDFWSWNTEINWLF